MRNVYFDCVVILTAMTMAAALSATATPVSPDAAVDAVDPFIGTSYAGNVFPGPTRPFGFVQPSPDSGTGHGRYAGGYKHEDTRIYGFSQTHLSGMGCADLGDVLVLPYIGEGPAGTNAFFGAKDIFSERAGIGYYSVTLTNFGIRAEVAAKQRVGMYRWTYPSGSTPKVMVDLQWGCFDPGPAPQLREGPSPSVRYVLSYAGRLGVDGRSLNGHRVTDGWMRDRHVAWHLVFSRPWRKATWVDDPRGGKAGRYLFEFEPAESPLECSVAISTCDEQGAARNYLAEADKDFDSAVAETRAEWRAILNRFDFDAEDAAQRKLFYTGLYHICVQPIDIADADGRYRGADGRIVSLPAGERSYYSNFSTWDTFRATHALYILLVPERVDGMVRSMLAHHRAVGCLPIHVDFGIENHCMIGVHSVPLIAESWLKGFRGFDADAALTAMTNSLTCTHAGYPREDWELLDRYGYIPSDKVFNQSASRTLEVAYDDACVARMAAAMGRRDIAARFGSRASAWTNVFDCTTGFVRGRDSHGRWREPFDPDRSGWVSDGSFDFTEASAWTYTWHVMHDLEGLVERMGGANAAADRLTEFFAKPNRYQHNNEPGHHTAYIFPLLGRPWVTQRLVRQILRAQYSQTADGLVGNDDCGQMSAWYVFATMGFYPVDPSACEYVIGAPQAKRTELRLANGRRLTVLAHGLSERAKYVRGVRWNGVPVKDWRLRHEDLIAGGTLDFEMCDRPVGGECGVSNETADPSCWPLPLRVQPEPYGLKPCLRDWADQPVDTNRWCELARRWTRDELRGTVFGVRPVERPPSLAFQPVDASRTRVTYSGPGGEGGFEVALHLPQSSSPAPVFILIADARTVRGEGDASWPIDELRRRGYAAVAFDAEAICPDDPAYRFDRGVHAIFSPEGRGRRSWGAVSAWAWGVSRVMDWLETQMRIDAKRVAVIGHGGKAIAALWAAADDLRLAMACVNGSGTGGARMNRMPVPFAANVAAVNLAHPHWFAACWRCYDGRETDYCLDAHDLAALVAPRFLAVGTASEDFAAGPVAEFATVKYASLAWEKFGIGGIRDRAFPVPGGVEANGGVSFHLRPGAPGLTRADWVRYLDFADITIKKR